MIFVWVWANRLSLGEILGLWLMLVGWMWRKCRLYKFGESFIDKEDEK